MTLPDLASELGRLAGCSTGDLEAEGQLKAAFSAIVRPGSAAFASISHGVAGVVFAHLLLLKGGGGGGRGGQGSAGAGGEAGEASAAAVASAASAVLARIGAVAVAEDIGGLARDLAGLCAVNEAVHGGTYERLSGRVG